MRGFYFELNEPSTVVIPTIKNWRKDKLERFYSDRFFLRSIITPSEVIVSRKKQYKTTGFDYHLKMDRENKRLEVSPRIGILNIGYILVLLPLGWIYYTSREMILIGIIIFAITFSLIYFIYVLRTDRNLIIKELENVFIQNSIQFKGPFYD